MTSVQSCETESEVSENDQPGLRKSLTYRDLLDLRQAVSVDDLVDRRGCLRPDPIDFH
jgi:hypothetical protein